MYFTGKTCWIKNDVTENWLCVSRKKTQVKWRTYLRLFRSKFKVLFTSQLSFRLIGLLPNYIDPWPSVHDYDNASLVSQEDKTAFATNWYTRKVGHKGEMHIPKEHETFS